MINLFKKIKKSGKKLISNYTSPKFGAWKNLPKIEGFYIKNNYMEEGFKSTVENTIILDKKVILNLTELNTILNPIALKKQFGHPFHLVTPSILPVTLSLAFLCVFQNFIGFMWFEGWHLMSVYQYHAYFFVNFFTVILSWVLEIFKEEKSAAHTIEMQKGFQYAILLFILSELMLFFSFFWAYFHFTLNSNSFTGGTYIPEGLVVFFWYRIPLLNTLLLLASGLSLTIAHILLVESDKFYKMRSWIKYLWNIHLYKNILKFDFEDILTVLAIQKILIEK